MSGPNIAVAALLFTALQFFGPGAARHAQQLAGIGQPGEGLVSGDPAVQVQKLLGGEYSPFPEGTGMRHGFRNVSHGEVLEPALRLAFRFPRFAGGFHLGLAGVQTLWVAGVVKSLIHFPPSLLWP